MSEGKVGRPRKQAEPKQWRMKAKPNWESVDEQEIDTPDKLRISPDLVPEGMSLCWVTDSVFGQGVPRHRQEFERKGWTPVHQEDFDGVFDGMFMPKGAPGEINVDGLVLMARPVELTNRAKLADRRRANEQVEIKERELTGGNLDGVTLDARHETALKSNRIRKSMERIAIPED